MMTFLKKHWLYILIAFFVVELAFFIPWAYTHFYLNLTKPVDGQLLKEEILQAENIANVNNELQKQMQSLPETLAQELSNSRIYFMLTNKGESHDEEFTQSFVFEDGSFSQPELKKDDKGDIYYSFSRSGEYGTFKIHPAEMREVSEGSFYKYVRSNQIPFPSLENATLIDNSDIESKQHPAISDAGEVLFTGWGHRGDPLVEHASDWSIFKAADDGPQFLTNGFMPKWLSNDEFVYLKNDGIYLAKSDLSFESEISTTSDRIYSNNRIDVSADGNKIAWIQPHNIRTLLFEKEGDSFVEIGSIEGKGYWVTFSPSGNFIAVQTINSDATGWEENPEPKIEFYNANTFEKIPELEIHFDSFNSLSMFMTDWVSK